MPSEKRTRNAIGRSSTFYGEWDKSWHGWVSVGVKDNGRPDRRHAGGKSKAEVTKKVDKLERERDEGKVRWVGQTWTVEQWLTHWLDTITVPPAITQSAFEAYEVAVRVHLVPGIGAHRIDRLQPEHLERPYRKMVNNGARHGRVHQVHRTIRAALNEALRRKQITENPAVLARAPKVDEEELEPCSVEEIQRILDAATGSRNSAAVDSRARTRPAPGRGPRPDVAAVNLDAGTLVVQRNRLRPKWRHGCVKPCGREQAGYCPTRVPARDETAATKSRPGRRGIGLPDPLVELLRAHREQQGREREKACELWQETGYVFTTQTGRPVNPSTDYHAWKRLLAKAGVEERRLHDARHTAATVLFASGCSGANGHVGDGLVQHGDGGPVPARRRRRPARCCRPGGRPALDSTARPDACPAGRGVGRRGTADGRIAAGMQPELQPASRTPGRPCGVARRFCWSGWRRMRDSNPRGRKPNTLSKADVGRSRVPVPVPSCDARSSAGRFGQHRTGANETGTETAEDRGARLPRRAGASTTRTVRAGMTAWLAIRQRSAWPPAEAWSTWRHVPDARRCRS
jgi:integrase